MLERVALAYGPLLASELRHRCQFEFAIGLWPLSFQTIHKHRKSAKRCWPLHSHSLSLPKMASTLSLAISSSTFTLPSSRAFSAKLSVSAMASAVKSPTKVVPAVIVGGGRVGRALQDMGSGEDLLVERGDPVPLDFEGPILVCTRNDDLDSVLEATPRSRWSGNYFLIIIIMK